MSNRFPGYMWLPLIIATMGLALVMVVSWQVAVLRAGEERRDCARAVATREDGRAMWLYVIGLSNADDRSDEEQERFDAFVSELNTRLPSLQCHDGNAVPKRD